MVKQYVAHGRDKDEAVMEAEFGLLCNYPNVVYDKTEVTKTAE